MGEKTDYSEIEYMAMRVSDLSVFPKELLESHLKIEDEDYVLLQKTMDGLRIVPLKIALKEEFGGTNPKKVRKSDSK